MTKAKVIRNGNNSKSKITKDLVISAIKNVYDPEIPVNVYDLGLIYDICIKDKNVNVKMTLTSPSCPMADDIPVFVADEISKIDGVNIVKVFLIWKPVWDLTRMSDAAKFELDLFNSGW